MAGGTTDPLSRWVEQRRAWRGRFAATERRAILFLEGMADQDLRVLTDPAAIVTLARAYDAANVHFLSRAAYLAELYRWMRFAPSHPDWDRDGLNAACMTLGAIEARAAQSCSARRCSGGSSAWGSRKRWCRRAPPSARQRR
mgnify:CR=1 FL=1